MNTASHTPDRFLRLAHRRARGLLLTWSLAFALLGCAALLAPNLGLAASPAWLNHLLGLAALLLLVIWFIRAPAISPAALARGLDREWALAARLEAAAELSSDSSALAAAQRADTARRLSSRRPPRSLSWFSALALAAFASAVFLAELSLVGFRRLSAEPAAPAHDLAPPPADISASLVWRKPKSEIKATAIEEIPLTALATTRTGLRSLSLEIAVNGQPRLSLPLAPDALLPLAQPGEHGVELSLYLDEVGAQEFDVVSYHLRADRATPTPAPPVASALQFIQIRPPREDVVRARGQAGELPELTIALKAAQLQVLKQNFVLAHAQIDHDLPEWRDENTRVASDQKTLAAKTAEVRDLAIAKGSPALVVDNLGQCIPLMHTAADLIAAAGNEPAAQPQGQALALLVATEKLIRKFLAESQGQASHPPPPPSVGDPFKDAQQFKLPPRAQTPAGQLEQLAEEQNAVAHDPGVPGAGKQAELARKLAELAASRGLDPSVQDKAEQAARDAAEAANQLGQGDPSAARAPAAAAAEALRAAIAAQETAGRAAAEAELEKIRRDINAAERNQDPAERAAALAKAAERLRAEAAAQQQTGSAAAARELAQAAPKVANAASEALAARETGSAPSPSDKEGKSSSGAGAGSAATHAQATLAPRDQTLARAARQVSRGVGSNPTPTGGLAIVDQPLHQRLAEMELGAQLAAELLPGDEARDLARRISDQARGADDIAGNLVLIPDDLRDAAHRLVLLLEAARDAGRRDEQIRRYNPDDIAPAYRAVVEAYFEKLSRDAASRP